MIKVGAVDCANDTNNQLCRDLEIMYYPMIKIFPPNSDEKFLGEDFAKSTVEDMRNRLLEKLRSYQTVKENQHYVNLTPVSTADLDSFWGDTPSQVKYLGLLFEPEDSLVGTEVLLDLSNARELQVRLVNPSNFRLSEVVHIEQGSNGVVIVERDNKVVPLSTDQFTRTNINRVFRRFLVDHGVNISLEMPTSEPVVAPDVNIADVMRIMQIEEDIKKMINSTSLSTIVFQLDLEGAIHYTLRNEIPLHRNISKERLIALKNYVTILIKYFPFGRQGVNFLQKLKDEVLDNKTEVDGKMFRQAVLRLEHQYKPFLQSNGWIGCQGSKPEYRGYPCSLWTMFHTLTVHEELRDRNVSVEAPEVLHAMAEYIKNFFTCSDCAGHFSEMAKTISGNVTTRNDSIMWLWAAHNRVNRRLAGDQTEDPKHPKVQFPTVEACPSCHLKDGEWDKDEVLSFLKNMFSNVMYLQVSDLTPKLTSTTPSPSSISTDQINKNLRHEIYGDDQGFKHQLLGENSKRSLWGFNLFDISICVVLYVCSVAILILVCIKFVFKRSYRKKVYTHDISSKV